MIDGQPLALRGKVVALSLLLNRFASGSIALTFLSLREAVGVVAAFSLYAGLGAAVSVFYYLCVPDATGKPLEDNEEGAHSGLAASDSAAHAGDGGGWSSLGDEGSTEQSSLETPAAAPPIGVSTPMVRPEVGGGGAQGGGASAPNYGTSGPSS